jgi:hypothetical protein
MPSIAHVSHSMLEAPRKWRAPAASDAALMAPAEVPQTIRKVLLLPSGSISEIARATPA